MRQVFTSVRLENVEAVERMLNEAGIQTKLSQGRTWKGNSRREFSYTSKDHDPSQQPAVWVLLPEDFKKARELLNEGGLLDSGQASTYVPGALQFRDAAPASAKAKANRVRLVLLIAVVVVGALLMARRFMG